jgi:hypothetical protein
MAARTPRAVATRLERRVAPDTDGEGFVGFGAMGLQFAHGDILAFRRAAASSIGPAYSSVWHRDARGRWTMFVDQDPHLACPRYFGAALTRTVRTEILLEWTGPASLAVTVPGEPLDWAIRLEPGSRVRAWNALTRIVPRRAFVAQPPAAIMGALAGRILGLPPLRLRGTAPNGQWFAIRPGRLWTVTASAGVVAGRDLGPMAPHLDGAHLGDLQLPARGLLMAGEWIYEAFDPDLHRRVSTGFVDSVDPALRRA